MRFYILMVLFQEVYLKSFDGTFPSELGLHHITRFSFTVGGAIKYEINSVNPDGHLVLFSDKVWHELDNKLTCDKIKAQATHSVVLNEERRLYHFTTPTKQTPTYMHLAYVQCNEAFHTAVGYHIELLNKFSETDVSQFDCSDADMLSLVQFFLLAYVVAFSIYGKRLYSIVKKGGPMHLALRMLTMAQIFKTASFLFTLVHYYRYSTNGYGFPYLLKVSKVLDGCSHYQMLVMTGKLVTGGILMASTAYDVDEEKIVQQAILGVSVIQTVLSLFNVVSLVLVIRIAIAMFIGFSAQKVIHKERSALKRDFYHKLVRDNYLWWCAVPLASVVSIVFSEYQQAKVVLLAQTIMQTSSVLFLFTLYISRSLYWEVSSLSSATLPLRMDNTTFHTRKYTS